MSAAPARSFGKRRTAPQAVIVARDVRLLDGDTVVARGIVSVSAGAPPVIVYDYGVYLPDGEVHGALLYRKVRAFYAGPSFEAVP
jgi:hypothetical protein